MKYIQENLLFYDVLCVLDVWYNTYVFFGEINNYKNFIEQNLLVKFIVSRWLLVKI